MAKLPSLLEQIVGTWRVNSAITSELLEKIPQKCLQAVPPASQGRTVADQFAHMNNARVAWLRFNGVKLSRDGKRFPSSKKGLAPSRRELLAAFRASGDAIEAFLRQKLLECGRVKMFQGSPVRWLGYLIAHESHHRGQIALCLKQNGTKLPDTVATGTLWATWGRMK